MHNLVIISNRSTRGFKYFAAQFARAARIGCRTTQRFVMDLCEDVMDHTLLVGERYVGDSKPTH